MPATSVNLKPGDIIRGSMGKCLGITTYHYAVVERVDVDGDVFLVHHTCWSIRRTTLTAFRLMYAKAHVVELLGRNEGLPPAQVVAVAVSRIGPAPYDWILWNCEHFPIECKTGSAHSMQTMPLIWGGFTFFTFVVGGFLGSLIAFSWLLAFSVASLSYAQHKAQTSLFHGPIMTALAWHGASCVIANASTMGVLHSLLGSLGLLSIATSVVTMAVNWRRNHRLLQC